jgi:GT2 family glycosyltransferase
MESMGYYVQDLFRIKSRGFGEEDTGKYDAVEEVDYVSGAGLAIKRMVIEQIGLLDPYFFSYGEDCDWCFRAKKAGYKVVVAPKAVMYHYGVTSWKKRPLKKTYLGERNRLYLALKDFEDVNPVLYFYGCLRYDFEDVMRVLKKTTIAQRYRDLRGKTLLKTSISEFVFRGLAQIYILISFPRIRHIALKNSHEIFESNVISKGQNEN